MSLSVYNRNSSHHIFSPRVMIIIIFFISIISISFVDLSNGYAATPGDTFVWERGNEKSVTGYVEATLLSIENNTVYIGYLSYDIVGVLELNITIKDGGFFWVDPADFSDWLSNGYATENITHLDIDFECIIRVREYGTEITTEYYDMESGLLVQSDSNLGNFKNLIAMEDIDVKQYVEDLGMGISFAPLGSLLIVCYLVIGMVYTRQQRRIGNH
ncbi:MAG: hypothetical protein ACTSYU_01765 [Promethearchaeota archaeon]